MVEPARRRSCHLYRAESIGFRRATWLLPSRCQFSPYWHSPTCSRSLYGEHLMSRSLGRRVCRANVTSLEPGADQSEMGKGKDGLSAHRRQRLEDMVQRDLPGQLHPGKTRALFLTRPRIKSAIICEMKRLARKEETRVFLASPHLLVPPASLPAATSRAMLVRCGAAHEWTVRWRWIRESG